MEEILELKKYTMFKTFKETPCHYFIYTKIPLIENNIDGNIFTSHITFKIHKSKLTFKKNYWSLTYDESLRNFKYTLQYRTVITRNSSSKNRKEHIISHLQEYFEFLEYTLENFL